MSNDDNWNEYRRLILSNFERNDAEIKDLQKTVQELRDQLRDQNWKMLIMAILGGIGGSGGVDIVKAMVGSLF